MFIRVKKIKGNKYAYLVENKLKKGKIQQKVLSYLGKVCYFEKLKNNEFLEYNSIQNIDNYIKRSKEDIIKDLIEFEMVRHGFKKNKNFLANKDVSFDLSKTWFEEKKVLAINEGFLCNYGIERLLNLKLKGEDEEKGLMLAKAFVESGINVPKEIFVELFHKFNNQ